MTHFDNSLYPIDIHNFAQGIDTFLTFEKTEIAQKIYKLALDMLWCNKKGYFYYQKNRFYYNKINYMRWSQCWMFYALSKYAMKEI